MKPERTHPPFTSPVAPAWLAISICLTAAVFTTAVRGQAGEEAAEPGLPDEVFKRLDIFEEQLLLKADNNFTAQQYKEAMAGYGRFVEKFPQSPAAAYALYKKARCGGLCGNKEEAVAAWQALVERFPDETAYAITALEEIAAYHREQKDDATAAATWAALACNPAYADAPEALSAVDSIARVLSAEEERTELLALYRRIAKSGDGTSKPAARARKGILKYYVKTAPDESKLREIYRHRTDTPATDPAKSADYWLWLMNVVEDNGDFGWSEKDRRKKYYAHWIDAVGNRFPDSDDFQIALAHLHYGADRDRDALAERLDKRFTAGDTKDPERVFKWIAAYRKNTTKMREYIEMITYETAGVEGIARLVALLYEDLGSTYTAKNTFRNICKTLPYEKLSNDDITKLITVAAVTLKDDRRAQKLAAHLDLDALSEKQKRALAREFLEIDGAVAADIYAALEDTNAGKIELFDYYLKNGDTTGAIAVAGELEEVPAHAAEYGRKRAELLVAAERYAEAAESYRKAGATLPLMRLAVTYHVKAGQTERAVEQLREIEKTFENEAAAAAYRIACLYRDAENETKQAAALRHVIRNYRGTPEARKAGVELARIDPLEIPENGSLLEP